MTEEFDWKKYYTSPLQLQQESPGYRRYRFEEEGCSGEVLELQVFSGMQVICNDLHMYASGQSFPLSTKVVEITYCLDGRYEYEVSEQYCFLMSAGDLAVGTGGHVESRGCFPAGHFKSVSIFVEPAVFTSESKMIVQHLGLDFDILWKLALQKPHYFLLRQDPSVMRILTALYAAAEAGNLPRVKLASLFVLTYLGELDRASENSVLYLNRRQVQLAKRIRDRLVKDLPAPLTISQLSKELDASPTVIKTSFRSVYGMPVGAWLRLYRMQEAKRILRETDLPAAEIAHRVGYSNPGKFSSAFHAVFGITPTQYRRQENESWRQVP